MSKAQQPHQYPASIETHIATHGPSSPHKHVFHRKGTLAQGLAKNRLHIHPRGYTNEVPKFHYMNQHIANIFIDINLCLLKFVCNEIAHILRQFSVALNDHRYIPIKQREIVLSSADSLLKQRFKNATAVGAGRV